MTIQINVTTASQTLADSAINHAITQLARTVAQRKGTGDFPTSPILDITFMLPGQLEKPAFNGMRMGGYTPEQNTLYFERAVPEHLVNSPEALTFVSTVLRDVVSNAENYFQSTDAVFHPQEWLNLADDICHSLES